MTTAIVGLGITDLGKIYDRTARQLAAQAVHLAVKDAGLTLDDVDGLLVSSGVKPGVDIGLQNALRLKDLTMLTYLQGFGSTAAQMVQYASMAVTAGTAETIVCVWADAPLSPSKGGGAAYTAARASARGFDGLRFANSLYSPNTFYALAARRHMQKYGTTQDAFRAIAMAQREWAVLNPLAQFRTPLTAEEYDTSRYIAEPFHLFDCCLVTNGAVAVIVTSADRARNLAQPPVGVLGWGQAHPGAAFARNDDFGLVTGAARSGPAALRMADTTLDEIDVVELYDCYTYTALVSLEDYGFCEKGEGGAFVQTPGTIGPNGKLKVNTGGGQLSSYYLWGMTPLSEAIIQARGQAGERQVDAHDRVLVSGNGGVLDHHGTLVLGSI